MHILFLIMRLVSIHFVVYYDMISCEFNSIWYIYICICFIPFSWLFSSDFIQNVDNFDGSIFGMINNYIKWGRLKVQIKEVWLRKSSNRKQNEGRGFCTSYFKLKLFYNFSRDINIAYYMKHLKTLYYINCAKFNMLWA